MKFKKYLDNRLLVLFCLPAFFLLHGINENFGLIPGSVVLELASFYFLLAAVLVLDSLLVFKDVSRSGVFSFYLLVIFFFFDALHDGLKSIFGDGFFSSYKFFLSLILLSGIGLGVFLHRTRKNLSRPVQYYSVLCLIFLCIELITFVFHSINSDDRINDLSSKNVRLPARADTSKAPDVFFIVFDEYTSSECLKKEFDYDNSEMDSLFSKYRFFLSRKSRSNYNITPFSLSSTFSLNYLDPRVQEQASNTTRFLQAMHTFKFNPIVGYFQNMGYQIKNFGCFELASAPTATRPYFKDAPYHQINEQTLFASIERDISFNWKLKNIFTGKLRIPDSYFAYKKYHLFRNRSNFQKLLAELKTTSDSPRFVYAHFMLPHNPFFLDSLGREISDTAMVLGQRNVKDAYLAQLKYANTLIKQLVPASASTGGKPRVVVIEGDHGFRNFGPETPQDRIYCNLNAYYFSDANYNGLYDSISPVNTFRIILNKYFDAHLPILKDTSLYVPHN